MAKTERWWGGQPEGGGGTTGVGRWRLCGGTWRRQWHDNYDGGAGGGKGEEGGAHELMGVKGSSPRLAARAEGGRGVLAVKGGGGAAGSPWG